MTYVTSEEIEAAIWKMVARCERPTRTRLREDLGHRGSMGHIAMVLKMWTRRMNEQDDDVFIV
jgi:hypothetical protein